MTRAHDTFDNCHRCVHGERLLSYGRRCNSLAFFRNVVRRGKVRNRPLCVYHAVETRSYHDRTPHRAMFAACGNRHTRRRVSPDDDRRRDDNPHSALAPRYICLPTCGMRRNPPPGARRVARNPLRRDRRRWYPTARCRPIGPDVRYGTVCRTDSGLWASVHETRFGPRYPLQRLDGRDSSSTVAFDRPPLTLRDTAYSPLQIRRVHR